MGNPLILLRRGSPPPRCFELDLANYLRETLRIVVYPGHIPQKERATSVAFLVVSESHRNKLSGPAGLATTRVQFTIRGDLYLDVATLHETLRRRLVRLRGPMGRTRVDVVLPTDGVAGYSTAAESSDRGPHRKVSEFAFHHDESTH